MVSDQTEVWLDVTVGADRERGRSRSRCRSCPCPGNRAVVLHEKAHRRPRHRRSAPGLPSGELVMRTARYAAAGFALGAGWGGRGAGLDAADLQVAGVHLGRDLVDRSRGGGHRSRSGCRRTPPGDAGEVRWWRVLAVSVPVMFLSPGIVLFPAAVIGGWGLRRGPVGRFVAALAILSAPVMLVVMSWEEVERWVTPYPENVYRLLLAAGGLVLGATCSMGGQCRTRPLAPTGTGRRPRSTRASPLPA